MSEKLFGLWHAGEGWKRDSAGASFAFAHISSAMRFQQEKGLLEGHTVAKFFSCGICGYYNGDDKHACAPTGVRSHSVDGNDPVNHPSHYTRFGSVEVIDIVEHLNFCRGNAIKYIARAGAKDASKEIEDLEKAQWYLTREIARLKKASNK